MTTIDITNINEVEDYSLSWSKDLKYYNMHIQPNLFGGISVIKAWGSSTSKRFGHKVTFCDSKDDVIRVLQQVSKKRKQRKYTPLDQILNQPFDTLLDLIAASNIEVLTKLIRKKEDINNVDSDGYTALMWAIHERNYKIASSLLIHGANINLIGDDGYTALMIAAWKGEKQILNLLMESGADIHTRNKKSYSALFYSILGRHSEISNQLKQTGAELTENEITSLIQINPNIANQL